MFDLVLSFVSITAPSDKSMASVKNNHCSQNMLMKSINGKLIFLLRIYCIPIYKILRVILGI